MTHKFGLAVIALASIAFAPIASAHDNGYNHRHQSSSGGDDQLVGGLIGAVAGGVIGSQLAGHGSRTEGSVIGAVVGGVAGAAIAGDGSSNHHYNRGYYGHNSGYYGGNYGGNRGYYGGNSGYYGGQSGYYNSYPTYRTTYSYPTYSSGYTSYPYYSGYSRPRTSLSINVGTGYGGYYGGGHHYRPSRYSRLPEPPRIGESQNCFTVQPLAFSQPAISDKACSARLLSLTIPPFPKPDLPT